eukprot:scaffold907_cov247-Pinguiococcus_pyrenoidosus.AAC.17
MGRLAQFLLSTNDKTIKLWRLRQRRMFMDAEESFDESNYNDMQTDSQESGWMGRPQAPPPVEEEHDINNVQLPSLAADGFQPVATATQVWCRWRASTASTARTVEDWRGLARIGQGIDASADDASLVLLCLPSTDVSAWARLPHQQCFGLQRHGDLHLRL